MAVKLHDMEIMPKWFDLVVSGIKKYEARTNDARRKNMNVGDYILLTKKSDTNPEKALLRIVRKIEFQNFTALYDALPKRDTGFEGMETADIVEQLHQFYTEELENKLGVVAIESEVVAIQ